MMYFIALLSVIAQISRGFYYPAGAKRWDASSTYDSFSTLPSLVSKRIHPALFATIEDNVETGPLLSKTKRELLAKFVKKMNGKRVIQRILIANNGMAATKAILSMRQWAYVTLGDERALEFVALATRDDLNANAEFIRLADTFVEVPSGSNKNNYANVDLIVSIAEEQQVDAVWPGWGHASENPKLPTSLKAKGIQFIGPTAPVMFALGDKVSANILAQTAEVPSIPWSGGGIKSGLNSEGVIPQDIFNKACVFTVDQAAETAKKIGYPVMIKASEGGGGKGIRMAKDDEELKTNFVQVQNEVPGSPIFMMQLCTNARHLEVQIVGDEYGNAIALNGRDCSTQRRFQKIFEEGPPSVAPKEVFREMELAAQRLTQSIGYIGAGTVEYLYNAASNKFFFLELNPRLQVEHPVTEGLTGTNLPATQLQVAMGIALDRIPEIRTFFGRSPEGLDKIDFMKDRYIYPKKHVIAARITAENPDEGFKPTSGRIERVKFQSTPRVWGYFSVGANGGIHEFADSQFGHVFASGETREEARQALVMSLKEIDVRGDIRTTVEYLIKLLETPEFKDNTIDTSWLDGIIREKTVSVLLDPDVVALSAAIFRAHSMVANQKKEIGDALSKGQTGLQNIPNIMSFPIEITYDNVKYTFKANSKGPGLFVLTINGQSIEVRIREQPDKSLLCSVAGDTNYQIFGQDEALGLRLKVNGVTVLLPTVFNPSELRSDVTGKVVRFLQADGAVVEKDKPFVEVEAMKMIMALKATESGAISHTLSPGSILSAGDLIATLKLKDPSKVKQIKPFRDTLKLAPQSPPAPSVDDAVEQLGLALEGYEYSDVSALLNTIVNDATAEKLLGLFIPLIQKFVVTELVFAGQEESAVVSSLAKAAKDNAQSLIPQLICRKQLKKRVAVVLALLREIELIPERISYGQISGGKQSINGVLPTEFFDTLSSLAVLEGSGYGEVALKARQMIEDSQIPPFETRLAALKSSIVSAGSNFKDLSIQPNMAVSVDLLVVLMSDKDAKLRHAAMEIYLRRVYRAHIIKSLEIKESASGVMSATWSFSIRDTEESVAPLRYGYMTIVPDALAQSFDKFLPQVMADAAAVLPKGSYSEPLNVLHIGLTRPSQTDDAFSTAAATSIKPYLAALGKMDIRTVNFFLVDPGKKVSYFNFLLETGFGEDRLSRNMRPTMPQLIELNRMAQNHDLVRIPAVGRNSYMFLGKEKPNPSVSGGLAKVKGETQQVIFLRSISLSEAAVSPNGASDMLNVALEELETAILDPRVTDTSSSRVYLNILPDAHLPFEETVTRFKKIMDGLISKYATRLLKLRVDEIEVKLRIIDPTRGPIPVRLMATSAMGGWLTREAYREYLDPVSGQTIRFCPAFGDESSCILDPYPTSSILQVKRAVARRVGSTYANDFLGLFEVALLNTWSKYIESLGKNAHISAAPTNLFTFEELILSKDGQSFKREKRFPGSNKIGMVAWHIEMKTPHYPEGREAVIIANDVTVQSGSFGVLEDEFFYKASEYARERGLPRVFISCNSGARIGLVDELKPKFKVAWKDEQNPALGFDYLYLTEDDYSILPAGTVDATPVTLLGPSGQETRYMLDAIIGQKNGIGVENLRGSGLIAGETSRAYDETFTLSYVTGRSVGIGAYLNRLGQRVIQMQNGPMILTGYSALNKLLGKEVYTSQDQLGGPQIMHPNGVTHEVVRNDQDGVQSMMDWLEYIPKDFNSVCPPLPMAHLIDPPTRSVGFTPSKTPYDPRHMLAGTTLPDGTYLSGFFDKNTFKEYLSGWGKSVVAGRAKLGGINVGVIAVETRLVEQRIPADPGNPDSRESILPQAGQVWYPDSAYKTAQVIQDFNRGENLPLIIFANWRGFSGGTRDMYGEILKFGAMIVDALRTYKHPVFVYIPPGGELRGGAWVVIDPTINPAKMEMYADRQSRGGILEPPGICEVKYREQEQRATMHRLDPVLSELDEALNSHIGGENQKNIDLKSEIASREKALSPLYLQVAHEFADLHDRAGRMKAKGCISEVLEWKSSRLYFYWRIRRRQAEDALKDRLVEASDKELTIAQAGEKLMSVIPASARASDEYMAQWLVDSANSGTLESLVTTTRKEFYTARVKKLLEGFTAEDLQAAIQTIKK